MNRTAAIKDDLFGRDVTRDPYAYFGRLRTEDPVHWNKTCQLWLITRYADVVWLTKHHELFSNAVFRRDPRGPYPPVDESHLGLYEVLKDFFGSWLAEYDPPAHTEMRRVISDYFKPRAIELWRPTVKDIIQHLLDKAEEKGRMDVLCDFAMPLPALVVTRMLGIRDEDWELIRSLTQKLLNYNRGEADRLTALAEGIQEFQAYLAPIVADRVSNPRDDLLSILASGENKGIFTRKQVVANTVLLLFAGHETTMNLICNGLLAFIRHPAQWELFKENPEELAKSATEECLRYDPPAKSIARIAAKDVEMPGGNVIKKDDRVRYIIASANRDPEQFKDPDTFDITRNPNPHVAFGGGIHYCLGATLARLEGAEVFQALARRFNAFNLESENLEYVPGITFRSLKSMPVTWT